MIKGFAVNKHSGKWNADIYQSADVDANETDIMLKYVQIHICTVMIFYRGVGMIRLASEWVSDHSFRL